MTERKSLESERAELVALADDVEAIAHHGTAFIGDDEKLLKAVSALRRLAAQDQKPVAGPTCRCHDDVSRKFCLDKDRCTPMAEAQNVSLPPPAAGWDEEVVPRRLLNERDNFIVSKGLWSEFVDHLKATDEALRTTPAATKSADTGGERSLTDDEHDRIVDAVMASGTVIGSLPDHGGADAGVGETLTLDDALEDLHDLLVAGATGEDIKIFAAEHPQFSDQIFAFTEAWFSAGESDE